MPSLRRSGRSDLNTGYGDTLRLFPSWWTRIALIALVVVYFVLPGQFTDFQLDVLNRAGIFAVGAIGLNLLTGYTGQVSLGHAFFMAIGAYTWAHFGAEQEMSILVWLPIAAVIGGVVGAVIGPFALRLRGNYLAIVSLGLVFIGLHIWNNFDSVTGGSSGISGPRAATIGAIDFAALELGGKSYTIQQSFFWLIWAVVAIVALLSKNIVRTRPGRAMQAVRDRDVAAGVIGVNLARYKVSAFGVSSAIAAVSGALFASYFGFIHPDQWNLILAIQFIAMIIVGGVGTIFGSILGAMFIAGSPPLISEYSDRLPVIDWLLESTGLSIDSLNQLLFGLVIVLFLVFEPHGMAGIWFRIKAYFKTWPFSY